MANPKHVEWLQEGVEAWNKRREREPFDPDLGGVVFSDVLEHLREPDGTINLNEINLDGAELSMADLSHICLRDSILAMAKLQGANLACAKLERAKCFEANLTDANLYAAELDHAELIAANLKKAMLDNCTLSETDLYGADLIGASLSATEPWKAKIFSKKSSTRHLKSSIESSSKEISSVSEFLEIFKTIKDLYSSHSEELRGTTRLFSSGPKQEPVFYFRGHRHQSWELCPSVMRSDELQAAEGDMLLDIMVQQPGAFKDLDSALAEWVLAQHHGLKTRLLDITRNPLVALFYACSGTDSSKEAPEDACLHIFAVEKPLIKTFSSDTISIIANFAKLGKSAKGLLLGKKCQHDGTWNSYSEVLGRLYYLIRREKPYFHEWIDPRDFFKVFVIEPQQSFDRIRVQSGAFLISGFHERFEREKILQWNSNIPVYDHYVISIPQAFKKAILDELRLLNIAQETLSPGLDEAARAITHRYSL